MNPKYGFIPPDYLLPGPYNVTFKQRSTNPVEVATLREQVRTQHLDRFETAIGLGGKEYRAMVEQAFAGTGTELIFPFAGLPLGLGMQAAKRAIASGMLTPTNSSSS